MDIYAELVNEQLASLQNGVRLVVVHPNFYHQRWLLNHLLTSSPAIYIRLTGDDLNGDELRQQYQVGVAEQSPSSGFDTAPIIILDECDRADPVNFDIFLEELLTEALSGDTRLFVITRRTPQFIIKQLELGKMTALLPVSDDLMLCDYLNPKQDRLMLEVHAFGQGRVYINGREIDSWDGVLPRSLFFYLVDRGMTTRNDIFDIFWPNLTTREATNVFHVTKRKISEVLGLDLTTYWSGFYRLSPDLDIHYDVMRFGELVQRGEIADDDEAEALFERALSIYHGSYLQSIHADWVYDRQHSLLQTYGEALLSLAKIHERQNDHQRSLSYYLQSAITNPQREDLVRHIMSIYADMGDYHHALTVYDRLVMVLKSSLDNLTPMPELQSFAEEIRGKIN